MDIEIKFLPAVGVSLLSKTHSLSCNTVMVLITVFSRESDYNIYKVGRS